jgi:uncharacterized protein (TIGR03663 family)
MTPSRPRLALFALALVSIVALALVLRLPHLARRPMHTDEAVHAVKLGILLADGVYEYNPHEFHGPTLYDATLPLWIAGGIADPVAIPDAGWLRIVPVLFGVGLILLLPLLRSAIGQRAALLAALPIALSPAFVFYSRYYIQETLFVFFALLLLGALWRWWRGGRLRWLALASLALGLLIATKETWVLVLGAMLGAAVLSALWSRLRGEPLPRPHPDARPWHALAAFALAIPIGALLLTNFMARPVAAIDMFRAFGDYFGRGLSGIGSTPDPARVQAADHTHPWWFYLRMLFYYRNAPGPWWSEAAILLPACVGIGVALARRGDGNDDAPRGDASFVRFLAFHALLLLAGFSLIPYKTPWLLLDMLVPLALLAGVGFDVLLRSPSRPLRVCVILLLVAACGHLAAQTRRATGLFEADTRNPYIYAHTSTNYTRLVRRLEDLAIVAPQGRAMLVKVVAPDAGYWPLPWDLRTFPNRGFWNELPAEPDADVVIVAHALEDDLAATLRDDYQRELYGLREEVLLAVYIRRDLWDALMEKRSGAAADVP